MNNSIELIESYIDGEMDQNEILGFEDLLSSDIGIKQDYELSMEINNSIIEEDVMALRETMDFINCNRRINSKNSLSKYG